jgi:penicillin amidase
MAALVALLLIGTPLLSIWLLLRASLADLDGDLRLAGPRAAVTLERDALGVTTVGAADRADVAFGTGFAHAQDRFFQMDLSRRLAAGELGELVGAPARQHEAA